MQQIPETAQFVDLRFPLRGLDVAALNEEQRPGTTPLGANVRAYEPSTDRNRGGARSGLSRYIDQQIAASKLQHLNVIVDPTTNGLLIDDSTDADAIDDPSSNNLRIRNPSPARRVRKKGSARYPSINKKKNQYPLPIPKGYVVTGYTGVLQEVAKTVGTAYSATVTRTFSNGTTDQSSMSLTLLSGGGGGPGFPCGVSLAPVSASPYGMTVHGVG